MSIEGLGKRFQEARIARGLSLDEAARMTKIRPSRLQEIEAEDFSNFPSLAYAKGFLVIYGKFLDVDVNAYLEAFETSAHMTVDGYSYLQDNPAPKAPTVPRPVSPNKTSLLPLVIGIVVLVGGFSLIKLFRDIQRIAPPRKTAGVEIAPSPSPTPGAIVAPRALPAESTPTKLTAMATPTAAPMATPIPTPEPLAAEPEIRRAEPVNPADVKLIPEASPTPEVVRHRVEIRPRKRTYLKVSVGKERLNAVFERWVSPGESIRFKGQRVMVEVLDRADLDIRKNGKPLSNGDSDVIVQ